ncbi:histidinolphosphatase [Pseudozyma hubeiensis SY62]|uniref:Histidinolphosphatase n=1 Tax=Pseudozyma hubeiensis (strain SY62) TaxID=1305764 RepID=R9PDB3_PSEHS|nr:histidinolphosphatase [Pseudozyma hubeiensis SY62]GAC96100.1 histidinolphosphatase [Pseudozyma hubeiensis SY62]
MTDVGATYTAADQPAGAFDIDLPFTSYDESHPLHFSSRPCNKFDGFWYIVGSSLPLWKPKKNVVIRYVPHPGAKPDEVKFADEIRSEPRSKSAADSEAVQASGLQSKWKREESWFNKAFGIKGTNVLQKNAKNGASYQWTGNGLLRFFHSKWQVIGYGPYDLTDTSRTKFDWVITYFEKTPATPAGIDLYVRDPRDMPESTYKAVLDQMKALKTKYEQEPDSKRKQLAGELTKLAEEFFDIPHDV